MQLLTKIALVLCAFVMSTAAFAGETIYYVQNDHLGTPAIITDANQATIWKKGDNAFGDGPPEVEEITFNMRFPGQYYDSESGLHYNWNRYYDSKTGRYVTSDPTGLDGGLNTYGYSYQNPVMYYDPNGETPVHVAAGVALLFIGGGAYIGCQSANCGQVAYDAVEKSLGGWAGAIDNLFGDDDTFGDDDMTLPPHWPNHPDAVPIPDDPAAPPTDAGDDLGGSGNSDRAKKCRKACTETHLPGEFRFRNCVRRCMANPEEFNCE